MIAAGLVLIIAAGSIATTRVLTASATPSPVTRAEAIDALRRLDGTHIRDLFARGWDVNVPVNREGDTYLNVALETCEWNPGHDRQQLLFVVRLLLDNGARIEARNAFGDTAYSIAKAQRYSVTRGSVTRMLHALCYNGSSDSLGDRCLATYERAPALPASVRQSDSR